MPRWLFPLIGVLLIAYVLAVLLSGTPEYLLPGAILAVIVLGYAGVQWALTRREMARHGGDVDAALRDGEDRAVPSAHLIGDDTTQAGDTPEVHDEINPRDLPIDHPGRLAAEEQAAAEDAETTGGEHFSRTEDRTTERTGEPQRSAAYAKGGGGSGGKGADDIAADEKTDVPGQRP